MIRSFLKAAAEVALVETGISRLWRRDRSLLVLLYHNVVPGDYQIRGETSLHVRFPDFVEQIDCARRDYPIVPLADALSDLTVSSEPRICITFDDAYRGAVDIAIPHLAGHGIPSTLFVAPGILKSTGMWWDRYSQVLERRMGEGSFRELALAYSDADDPSVDALAQRMNLSGRPVGPFEQIASENEILPLIGLESVTLAPHSWSHRNLSTAGKEDLEIEMSRPLTWFKERGMPSKPWIAYPYGLASLDAANSAREAGYQAGLLASGGWIRHSRLPSEFEIPRLSVPRGLSLNGFRLRLDGLLGSPRLEL